jgi:signal transduction histidine kinase
MIPVATEMRKTGIDVVADMPWGTHICLFYETKEDLLDTLISYFKSGLESGEFCLWVVAEPLTIEEASDALKGAVPDLDRYLADSSIEIVSACDWYLQDGTFALRGVTGGWHEKLAHASARGYAGVRATGDSSWLEKKYWKDFCEYEESVNEVVANQRLAVLCTYALAPCGAVEILDVVRTHQFTLARRNGSWDVIETAGLKQAKAEIKRLNEELEQRVEERTSQLMVASEALREAQADLARATRMTTMGELVASIAHEVNQPLMAVATNADACLSWLANDTPQLDEAQKAAERIVRDSHRAGDIIKTIRALARKSRAEMMQLDVNDVIAEVLALTRGELRRHGVSLETELAGDLETVMADRIQVQQVILNLVINGIEAMNGIMDRPRTLRVSSRIDGPGSVLIAVTDAGSGLDPAKMDRIFDAFFTTKPEGMGMGLSICRSIIEAHGGRLWASPNLPYGSVFQFTMPAVTQKDLK